MSGEPHGPRRAPEVVGNDLGDELVLRDGPDGRIHVLNAAAREVYLLCDGTRGADEIARDLAAAFGITLEQARDDARGAIAEMTRLGILLEG